MASRWSSEFVVAEHRDLQASAMTMDRDGNNILLAGKRYIAVKNLNDSSDTLRKFLRHNKYEVGTAEWNPTLPNAHFCALSTNQKIELFCSRETSLELAHTLKFHTRLVSDLNWHRFDPNVLASASVDTFTHVWDIRDPRRPSLSFSAVACSNHVKWNKLSSYLLATAHDGDIRIWDQRKGTAPIQYISAHFAKIHGLDWSPTHEYQLASCSQDGTVKFFDVTNPRCPESLIQTAAPVWRARYTPFGEGLVTVVVPQSRRGENSLLLWNLSNQSMPVHTFVGHTDVVLEFEWRKQRLDFSDYQLITWSRDQSLRIWRIEPFLQKLCGYDMDGDSQGLGEDLDSDIVNITNNDLPSAELNGFIALDNDLPAVEAINVETFNDMESSQYFDRNSLSPQDSSKSLELEFSLLSTNVNSTNFKFDEMDVSNRSCMVTATVNSHIVSLQITFPPSYPYNAAPSFQIEDNSTIDALLKTKLLKVLKQTAQQRVRKNRICLESCLTQLVHTLERSVQMQEIEKAPSRLPAVEPSLNAANSYLYGPVHDAQIPYPKTCGARFCSVDMLVCFYRPSYSRRISARPDVTTPRSLSAVAGSSGYSNLNYPMMFVIPTGNQDATDGALPYYMQDRNTTRSRSSRSGSVHIAGRAQPKPLKTVTIYDCSKLFFIHKELGEKYIFDPHDIASMCHRNATIAGSLGRQDLVQIWTLAALVATPFSQSTEDDDVPWPHHPFSRSLIEYLILHYAKMSDVQTAAMLCCAFATKNDHKGTFGHKNINSKSVAATRLGTGKWRLKPGGSPYHTIHPADTTLEGWNFPAIKQNRSNSWSESLDDLKFMANILEHREMAECDYEKNKMLDEKNSSLYDELKKKYADILHRWNLLEARAQVTKFLSVSIDPHKTVEFLTECQTCKKPIVGPSYCTSCKKVTLRCSVCRILVRGSSNFCLICGHGGHTNHMMAWFTNESSCPTGCGCKCVKENLSLLES